MLSWANMDHTPFAVLLFVLIYIPALIFGISRFSGWNALATRYPRAGAAPKALTIFGYGMFRGWFGYNGGLVISADGTGLYLSTLPYILAWHKPAFIPWKEITEARARLRFWKTYYTLSLRGAPEIDFALGKRAFDLVRPFLLEAGVPVVELP